VAVGSHNFRLLAAESDVVLHEPLLDPGFLGALSSRAQWLGFPGRTRAMQAIFGSLLPEEVLARQTKAYTTSTVFGPWTRKFVREWTGSGVDTTLVDQEALRRTWAAADIPVATLLLVQHSWLALSGVEPAHEKA
jgi:asparagine synthase (glutamine-hydrolysing)